MLPVLETLRSTWYNNAPADGRRFVPNVDGTGGFWAQRFDSVVVFAIDRQQYIRQSRRRNYLVVLLAKEEERCAVYHRNKTPMVP